MNRKQWLAKLILLSLVFSMATLAIAALDPSLLEMSEQMDGIEQQEFQSAIDKANACTSARNFPCAESELAKAAKVANTGKDKKMLLASRNGLAKEKQQLAYEIKRAEEERQAQIRRDEEEKQAQRRRKEEREERLWQEKYAAHQEEGRQSAREAWAGLGAYIQQQGADISSTMANIDRQTNAAVRESNRVRAEQAAERERARAEKEEREAERRREAERDRAARADAQRTADAKRAQEEARIRQQEQERQQEQARKKEQERRKEQARQEELARKQEQARKKAEEEKAKLAEQQAEEQAMADYLEKMRTGIRLGARNCYGEIHVGGSRPSGKAVVDCIDVAFTAYCPGSASGISGVAKNFIGFDMGCFGDTTQIAKPDCKPGELRIVVDSVKPGCN